jgi:hypothetical protein
MLRASPSAKVDPEGIVVSRILLNFSGDRPEPHAASVDDLIQRAVDAENLRMEELLPLICTLFCSASSIRSASCRLTTVLRVGADRPGAIAASSRFIRSQATGSV